MNVEKRITHSNMPSLPLLMYRILPNSIIKRYIVGRKDVHTIQISLPNYNLGREVLKQTAVSTCKIHISPAIALAM